MELKIPWNGLVHHDITSHGGNRQRIFGMGFLLLNTDGERGGSVWDLGIKHTNFKKGKKEEAEKGPQRHRNLWIFGNVSFRIAVAVFFKV